jgi:hypothetical protein
MNLRTTFVNNTVSDDVDGFHWHAGVSEEVLKACGDLVQSYLYSDLLPYFGDTARP